MFKFKFKFTLLVCVLLTAVTLTGCAPKDDFANYEVVEFDVENVTAKTEFPEYPGDIEMINVIVTNDGDDYFYYGEYFLLQKFVNGEWKGISVSGRFKVLGCHLEPHSEVTVPIRFKDSGDDFKYRVKLPLLPGLYRVCVGGGDHTLGANTYVPAEFTVI